MNQSEQLYTELANRTAQFKKLLEHPRGVPEHLQQSYLANLKALRAQAESAKCRDYFLPYLERMWGSKSISKKRADYLRQNPTVEVQLKHAGLLIGEHHKRLAKLFEDIAAGKVKRAYVAMPPRYGKSEFGSIFFPSWYLGKFPDAKILQISNQADLAKTFGGNIRNLVAEQEFQDIFPGIKLSKSTKAKDQFETNYGGIYISGGIGSKLAGKGADLAILDDPHSEQDALKRHLGNDAFDQEWEWFKGFRQRFQNEAALIVIATRWWATDIPGRIMAEIERGDTMYKWEVVEVQALLDEGTENERSSWPEMWPTDAHRNTRREQGPIKWAAQYQQKPLSTGMNIIPRETWKDWTATDEKGVLKPPPCSYIILALDPANSSADVANPSGFVCCGVFEQRREYDEKAQQCLILLDAEKIRLDYMDLKKKCIAKKNELRPHFFIIESRQSGQMLIQELRATGLNITPYVAARGPAGAPNGKVHRYESMSEVFRQGLVYAPLSKAWAKEVQDQLAEAPFGKEDDLADAMFMCVNAFRRMGMVSVVTDNSAHKKESEEEEDQEQSSAVTSYW